jgi:hypothetical protein
MSNEHEYRWHSQSARGKALGSVEPLEKALWQLMAQAWGMLAADAETASTGASVEKNEAE